MKYDLLNLIRCPQSQQLLKLSAGVVRDGNVESGELVSEDGQHHYEIRDSIPRFVPASNYAESFGMQWNKFSKTQLDSCSGHPISADRFWTATSWTPDEIAGQWVLDVGCGAGRFAEVALSAGARVVALDYSRAADACFANLGHHENFHVVQGDIYSLPFEAGAFPFVYSLGVLQHTPDVAQAVTALFPMVAPGGRICIDFYEKSWKSMLLPKYWLRPLTTRIPDSRLFSLLEFLVPKMLPLSRALGYTPLLGGQLKRLVPVANYFGSLPLNEQQQLEWSLLDTFDWLSPQFDNPQTPEAIGKWLREGGFANIEVLKAGHLVGRASARATEFAEE